MLLFGKYQNIMNFLWRPIKVAYYPEIIILLSFGMNPQLINMDLWEGMIIKDNIYTYTSQNIYTRHKNLH
jgi:hypothetical protein